MNEVPTLLVGLGGIGSQIVNQVCGMIPEERRSRIAPHIFDTNVNDISKMKNLNKDWRTQTSKDLTVEQYLNILDEAEEYVKDWFPHEQREIRRKSLTEGAGQVRGISRLAYRAAMQEGKLNNLHRQLTSIFKEVGEAEVKSARVMIVSSLAGGTGGGIFLQTAMYLREILKKDYNRQNVLIRGAFILPDILALTNTVSVGEIENIQANAYACLKELNAITRNASSSERASDRVEIELEYKPNQRDASGRLNHAVTSDHLPYDFCFLYDFENTAKNNLQYVENYYNQVAQSIYLELFSPIADNKFSRQDNQILELVRHEGMNRYCGAGVARLVYPYKQNIQYFALKWATESLSNDWLKIDNDFDKEYRQYEQDLQNGVNRDEPKISERYVWLLDNMARDEDPKPFFKLAHRAAHIIGKQNEIEGVKAELFLTAMEEEVDKIIKSDVKLNQIQSECEIDETRLKDKDRMANEILKVEDGLILLENEVNKFVRESKTFIINQVFLQDCDARRFAHGKDYQLNTWMISKNEPVHPVTVRYILYQVVNLLEERLNQLVSENTRTHQSILNYKKAYDLPETEDIIEDAMERVRIAKKQSLLGKIYRNELKEFREEYYEKASSQRSNLIKYKKQKLLELVQLDVRKAVLEILEDWERYFKNLRNIRNKLQQDLNKLAVEEERGSDPTIKYVLASKEVKEKLWNDVRRIMGISWLPTDISEQIYTGQYQRFCQRRKNEYLGEESIEKVETMFRKDVLGWCEKELEKQDSLKLNCIEAIRREGQLEGRGQSEIEARVEELVKTLDRLSRPFVPDTVHANRIDSWGIHPDTLKELSSDQRNDWFGSELIVDSAFSEYEIIRYKSNFNLKINDFPKFSYGDQNKNISPGNYFVAYTNRIKQLTGKRNTVTPHLDKRWHLQAFLPDLNPRKAQEEESMIDRALIIGIIMGYLRNVDNYGDKTWELFEEKNARLIKIGDRLVDKYTYSLHRALFHNPIVVDKIMNMFAKEKEYDRDELKDKIAEHKFYKGATGIKYQPAKGPLCILDLIFKYSEDKPTDETLPQKEFELLDVLLDEIYAYFEFVFGGHKKALARKEAAKFIEGLKQESKIYNKANAPKHYDQWELIFKNKEKEMKKS
jgi:hypothetical protein